MFMGTLKQLIVFGDRESMKENPDFLCHYDLINSGYFQ